MQMAKKFMKIYKISLTSNEMQIKTTVRYQLTPARLLSNAQTKKQASKTETPGQDSGQIKHFFYTAEI
jgi:hypothetical protein